MPRLADIRSMAVLLAQHGVGLSGAAEDGMPLDNMLSLTANSITQITAPYELVRKMRASVLVLGPLLARCGEARVSLPGGCAIGTRPVDLHLMGLKTLGANIEIEDGYIVASAPQGLRGGQISFPTVSVGATENLIMAASLAKGRSELINAAREPEIVDLCHCLQAMGAQIEGIGSDHLIIEGVDRLHGAEHKIICDRIETGTYAIAAAITGGEIELIGASLKMLNAFVDALRLAGVSVKETERGLLVARNNGPLQGVDVITEPFPGFPTDLQAQMMALMSIAEGASMLTEAVFENRFMHAPELMRMGAKINVHGASAIVRGVKRLTGAPVMATDLRASVALILAGLAADGMTELNRVYHLDRGYEKLEEKLSACGARIERIAA
jgi:UDP-N-acetylglucosamine 1-carboxyvinyltransferase